MVAIKKFKDSEGNDRFRLNVLYYYLWTDSPAYRLKLVELFPTNQWLQYLSFLIVDNADVKRTTMREVRVLKMLKQENIVQLRLVK